MEFQELEAFLKSDRLPAGWLVHGPEPFFRAEAVALIRRRLSALHKNLDIIEFDALDVEPLKLFEDLQVPSLFAPTRLVIVDNAGPLFADAANFLENYLQAPTRGVTLLLVTETLGRKASSKKN